MKNGNIGITYEVVTYRGLTICDLDECGQPIKKVHELYVNGKSIGEFGYVCAEKVKAELKRDKRRLEERFN